MEIPLSFIAFIVCALLLYFVPVTSWITAIFADVKVTIGDLIGMRIRRIPPDVIVNALITADKAGFQISITGLETHYLSGGNVPNVIRAMVTAKTRGKIELSFKKATAIDLAGRDVFEEVRNALKNPIEGSVNFN